MSAPRKNNRLTVYIILAMAAGIGLGFALNQYFAGKGAAVQDKVLEPFSILADVFLRLIKMIVAPVAAVACSALQ